MQPPSSRPLGSTQPPSRVSRVSRSTRDLSGRGTPSCPRIGPCDGEPSHSPRLNRLLLQARSSRCARPCATTTPCLPCSPPPLPARVHCSRCSPQISLRRFERPALLGCASRCKGCTATVSIAALAGPLTSLASRRHGTTRQHKASSSWAGVDRSLCPCLPSSSQRRSPDEAAQQWTKFGLKSRLIWGRYTHKCCHIRHPGMPCTPERRRVPSGSDNVYRRLCNTGTRDAEAGRVHRPTTLAIYDSLSTRWRVAAAAVITEAEGEAAASVGQRWPGQA